LTSIAHFVSVVLVVSLVRHEEEDMTTPFSLEARLMIGGCVILILIILWRLAILAQRARRTRRKSQSRDQSTDTPRAHPEHWLDIDWKSDEHTSE